MLFPMKYEVTYYIKSSEIIEATSKKKARQQLLRISMEELDFPVEGILVGEPKKIKERNE